MGFLWILSKPSILQKVIWPHMRRIPKMMLNVMAFIVAKTHISRKEEISRVVDNQTSFQNSLT